MVAPVLNLGQRARCVYFPQGANWTHHYTAKVYKGGTTSMVLAPLDEFPLFKRTQAPVPAVPARARKMRAALPCATDLDCSNNGIYSGRGQD
jgi:alpha-glucosidase (family GH31 glycosyl hydrolase)